MSSSSPSTTDQSTTTNKLYPGIKYNLPPDLTLDQLHSFPAFKIWINALTKTLSAQSSPTNPYHSNPYKLRSITVQSVDRFSGKRLGFIKFNADVSADDGQRFPGTVFMRGGSVAMLLILKAEGDGLTDEEQQEESVILTVQPRIPAGTFTFVEIPAGMIDDSGTFSGAAAREIEEETGLRVQEGELVDMTELAFFAGGRDAGEAEKKGEGKGEGEEEEVLQNAIYPSPGGSDEFIPIFLVRKTMSVEEIKGLEGKLTGLRDHGEKISLKIVKLKDVWKVAGRDAKTLSALYLYDVLRKEGRL